MNPLIKKLHEQRLSIEAEIRSIVDSGRELNAEDNAQIDALISRSDELNGSLTSMLEAEDRASAIDRKMADYQPDPDADKQADPEVRSDLDVIRDMARGERRSAEFAPTNIEHRVLSKLSAGAGANIVPTSFYDTLVESLLETSAVLSAEAMVIRTAGGEPLQVPTSNTFPTASLVTEANTIGASDPAFGQVTLGAYKYAFLTQLSSELLTDEAVNVTEFLARRGGEALGNGIGTALVTGSGSSQPTGIAGSAGFTTVASASGSAAAGFTYADVLTLQHSITRPYRAGASFICNDSVTKTLRLLRANDGGAGTGQFLWQPALTAGAPDVLAGAPVYTDPAMPTATTNGGKGLAYGNWARGLMVRFAGPVRVESSDEFAFSSDLQTWRFIIRADSKIVDAGAARVLTYTT